MRATASGVEVARLRLAVPRRRRNGKDQGAVYVDVTAFDDQAVARQYLEGQASSVAPPAAVDVAASAATSFTNDDYRRAIKAIPKGKVAAYSVVSEVVRGDQDGSQKVAGLAANDATLGTAYRVVKRDGGIAAGFRWSDGRMGGPEEGQHALEEEGVRFDARGRVLPEFMLTVEELRELYAAQED